MLDGEAAEPDEEVGERGRGPALLAETDCGLDVELRGEGALADGLQDEGLRSTTTPRAAAAPSSAGGRWPGPAPPQEGAPNALR